MDKQSFEKLLTGGAFGDDVPGVEAPPTLATISAVDLQQAEIPPIRWVVENFLTTGLTLLASPPKYGKSWLVLALCLCVSNGWKFLGYKTNKGRCLYLSLEDSERRLKSRMEKLLCGRPAPEEVDFATMANTIDGGLLDQLEGYAKANPGIALIALDTFQRVRNSTGGRTNIYAEDYAVVSRLKAFADSHNLCLVLVHHLRKMMDDSDPFNRISGSTGILGAADTAMVLTKEKRDAETATLSIVGRDVESVDIVLKFDKTSCAWMNLGDADAYAEQQARMEYQENPTIKTIKTLLKQSTDGSWTGTAQQLLDAGTFIAKTRLAPTARDLSSKLKQMDNLLFEHDNIVHERKGNGTGGGKHSFHYPPQFEELPQEEIIPFPE